MRSMVNEASLGSLVFRLRFRRRWRKKNTCGLKSINTDQPMTINRKMCMASTTAFPEDGDMGSDVRHPLRVLDVVEMPAAVTSESAVGDPKVTFTGRLDRRRDIQIASVHITARSHLDHHHRDPTIVDCVDHTV